MYSNPYSSERSYTGQSPFDDPDRCRVCGATGDCPDTQPVAMPYPPVDIAEQSESAGGPLLRYTVTVYGTTTVMRLNDLDAVRYGDAAVPIP